MDKSILNWGPVSLTRRNHGSGARHVESFGQKSSPESLPGIPTTAVFGSSETFPPICCCKQRVTPLNALESRRESVSNSPKLRNQFCYHRAGGRQYDMVIHPGQSEFFQEKSEPVVDAGYGQYNRGCCWPIRSGSKCRKK